MNRLARISATVASSACLVAGFAGVAGATPDVTENGNNTKNSVNETTRERTRVDTRTRVRAVNNNPQDVRSGDVNAHDNRNVGGTLTSGGAGVTSDTLGSVNVNNTVAPAAALNGGGAGSDTATDAVVDNNGNNSDNSVNVRTNTRTTVDTRTNVRVVNNNEQNARSGNVSATDNRDVGNLSSGAASAESVTTFEIDVRN